MHTHGNVLWAAKVNPTNIDFRADDVYLAYLPFFHVNTQSWAIWTVLGAGGTVVLQPKFSASRFWEVIAQALGDPHLADPVRVQGDRRRADPRAHGRVGVFGLIMPVLDDMARHARRSPPTA